MQIKRNEMEMVVASKSEMNSFNSHEEKVPKTSDVVLSRDD